MSGIELDLYNKWIKTEDPIHFQSLYTLMKPDIHKAASRASFGSNLPQSAHQAWAAQSFFDALKTFKPTAGASLKTHVYGSVNQKAKRLNYLYQSLGYAPEPRKMQVGLYQTTTENLRNKLDREPSTVEIAEELGWGLKDVEHIRKESAKELGFGEGLEDRAVFESSVDEEMLDYLYFELGNEERVVYDYIYGKHGHPRMVKANNKIDYDGIASRVGFSASKVRTIQKKLSSKLEKYLKR